MDSIQLSTGYRCFHSYQSYCEVTLLFQTLHALWNLIYLLHIRSANHVNIKFDSVYILQIFEFHSNIQACFLATFFQMQFQPVWSEISDLVNRDEHGFGFKSGGLSKLWSIWVGFGFSKFCLTGFRIDNIVWDFFATVSFVSELYITAVIL